jgi:hypothetical protein
MPIRAQSADGKIHEFPDGTSPQVIDKVMLDYTKSNKPASSGIPEGRKATRYDVLPPGSLVRELGDTFDVARNAFAQSQAKNPTRLGATIQPYVAVLSGAKRGVEDFTQGAPALFGLPGAREYKNQKEAQYKAATPNRLAAEGARLAMQAAITYPIGGALALPVKALARAAPAVARYAAPIAAGLETGGFRTGMKPTSMGGEVANALVRGGTGATTGAGTAVVAGQDPNAGASIGAALPLVGVPFGKAVVGALDFFGKKGADVAATAVQKALGPNATDVIALLNSAPEGMTAKQFLAQDAVQAQLQSLGVKNPQVIVGLATAIEQGPDGLLAFAPILKQQAQARTNVLAAQAGGPNQTAALASQQAAKDSLNALTGPMRQEALNNANIGGKYIPNLKAQAGRLEGQAATDVETVRRMERLAPVAAKSLPRVERVAKDQAERSAAESLVAGKAARDAKQIAANISEAGLKPIDTDALTSRLTQMLNDNKYAGNNKVSQSVRAVLSDVSEWAANNNGIIDAEALYSIQKNTVSDTINALLRGEDPSSKRKAAAAVMTKINPLIDDAIKKAGGESWLDYKNAYFTGMKDIERRQMSAQAMQMLKDSPNDFVKLVRGDNPDAIEKVFGPGSYDIVKEMGAEMGPSRMTGLQKVAGELELDVRAGELANIGGPAALEILKKDRSIPTKILAFAGTFAQPKVAAAARLASAVKDLRIAPEVEAELIASFKSGKSLAQLIARVPAAKRRQAAIALANPAWWSAPAAVTVNALAPDNPNSNALAQ